MIGRSVKLYDMVLQFLRTLFLRTRNVHYCTLRAELLMSLHDLDVGEICSVDPCHKFTWCLDACIREKFVDAKRARELQGFLDGVKKGQEQVLGDLSMILCDPFATNTLVLSTMRNLQELVSQDALPRDSPDLLLQLRMLSLGQGAWDMIDSQVFKEPRLDSPDLLLQLRMLSLGQGAWDMIDSQVFKEPRLVGASPACFLVNRLGQPLETYNDMAFSDVFLHLFTGSFTLLSDEFGAEEFCNAVFDGFFLMSFSSKENVHRHILRLILHLHHKILPSRLESLIKTLEPSKQTSEAVKELYTQLMEKLDSQKKSPAQPAEPPSLDLPLHTVAVPAAVPPAALTPTHTSTTLTPTPTPAHTPSPTPM
ncbi:UNVERIFIED_CONTAM: hypothetical protein FKN15_052502 [Acipenser sinensis]